MTRIIRQIETPGDQPWTNDQLEVIEAVAQVIFEPGEFSENALADLLWRHAEGNCRAWIDDQRLLRRLRDDCTDAAYVLGGVAKVLAERQAEHVANLTEPGQEPTAEQIEAVEEWIEENLALTGTITGTETGDHVEPLDGTTEIKPII